MAKIAGWGAIEGGAGGTSPRKKHGGGNTALPANAVLPSPYHSPPHDYALRICTMKLCSAAGHNGNSGGNIGGGATGAESPHGGGWVRLFTLLQGVEKIQLSRLHFSVRFPINLYLIINHLL